MDVDYFSAARSKCILAECIHRMSIQKHPTQLNLKQGEPERKTSKSQRKCRAICRAKWNCEPGHVTTYSCHGKRRNGGAEELSEGAGTSGDLIVYAESPTQLIIYLHASSVSYLGNTKIIS